MVCKDIGVRKGDRQLGTLRFHDGFCIPCCCSWRDVEASKLSILGPLLRETSTPPPPSHGKT
jgi:hypothetical protein